MHRTNGNLRGTSTLVLHSLPILCDLSHPVSGIDAHDSVTPKFKSGLLGRSASTPQINRRPKNQTQNPLWAANFSQCRLTVVQPRLTRSRNCYCSLLPFNAVNRFLWLPIRLCPVHTFDFVDRRQNRTCCIRLCR